VILQLAGFPWICRILEAPREMMTSPLAHYITVAAVWGSVWGAVCVQCRVHTTDRWEHVRSSVPCCVWSNGAATVPQRRCTVFARYLHCACRFTVVWGHVRILHCVSLLGFCARSSSRDSSPGRRLPRRCLLPLRSVDRAGSNLAPMGIRVG
jgi:hypothetical protein